MPLPRTIRLLQGITIFTLGAAGGLNASLSLLVVPRIRESPAPLLLRQFAAMVSRAFTLFPAPLLLPGLAHAWLAHRVPQKRGLYIVAAALSFSITPWTWGVMMPLNRILERRVAALDAGVAVGENKGLGEEVVDRDGDGDTGGEGMGEEGETAQVLIDKWARRHLYRPTVTLLAACLGLYVALS
ncbi:hypothetical protein F5B20DRAFT_585909 [Whalleya microplaca]|nr:hypothetical protein F5B20DRAFT_585909 [Whalleya microplaca]